MTDARKRLESHPFTYRATRSGTVFISRGGRVVMELGGVRAASLMRTLNAATCTTDEQLALARVTGHYKH
ncbi:MAG: hypothetical protein ACOH1T_00490 [Microbacteriaceae bacterium]